MTKKVFILGAKSTCHSVGMKMNFSGDPTGCPPDWTRHRDKCLYHVEKKHKEEYHAKCRSLDHSRIVRIEDEDEGRTIPSEFINDE